MVESYLDYGEEILAQYKARRCPSSLLSFLSSLSLSLSLSHTHTLLYLSCSLARPLDYSEPLLERVRPGPRPLPDPPLPQLRKGPCPRSVRAQHRYAALRPRA